MAPGNWNISPLNQATNPSNETPERKPYSFCRLFLQKDSPKTRRKKSYTETQEESTYNSQTPFKYPIQSILSPMNQLLLYLNGQKIKVLSNHIFELFSHYRESTWASFHQVPWSSFLRVWHQLQPLYKSVPHFA